ncbi:Aminoacylase-1 [Smittium culicis]|uniref:Aminoacylase-1 n=1 Tax=Smittium culicis TaxID=133412 RepID=A0A1R1Y129_9FUNG|nr:Aminoacylase-1 [Smittium culicis]
MEPESVSRFREYLRIESVHPNPDYYGVADFLKKQAEEIGVEYQCIEAIKGKPVVVLKLAGSDPSLKSVILNSHSDVVPVYREKWKYEPFGAERVQIEGTSDYKIYARGAQDMKVTGSCYLEAFRTLKKSGKILKRNVYAMFVPDEEIGGKEGMGAFIKTKEFKDMNAGFDIDEGIQSLNDVTYAFFQERTLCWVKFIAHGNTGHGSQFIEGTAIEKLLPVINELSNFRKVQLDSLKEKFSISQMQNQGNFTSVNLTMLEGGKQPNVIPATYSATFDIRVTPNTDLNQFFQYLESLAADNDVSIEYINRDLVNISTTFDKNSNNLLYTAFLKIIDKHNINLTPTICPGITDARFVRAEGIPAIGINPMTFLPFLAHDHDEYITESKFIKAIDFYIDLITEMANVDSF